MTLRRHGSRRRYAAVVLFFLLPSLVPLVLFTLVPMAASVWVSLHDWNLIRPAEYVGLDNYAELVRDPQTWAALKHTVYYIAGYLPLVLVGGLGLAVALNTKVAGRGGFRAVYFLPVVTSWVVVALVWKWLLNPGNGLVNEVLGAVGIAGPGWWTDPAWAMPSVIIASAWKDLGFVMVILLAGLQAVPQELLEAAKVDGAQAWQRFRPHHAATAVPADLLRRRHLPDQRVPGLRPGVRDDRRGAQRRHRGGRPADLRPDLPLRPGR